MAWNLNVVVGCKTRELCKSLAFLLDRDTRPDFVEDVDAGVKPLYEAVETLDFPVSMSCHDRLLYIVWHDTGTQIEDVISAFGGIQDQAGIKAVFLVPDEPLSGDEDEDEDAPIDGFFYVMRDNALVRVSRDIAKSKGLPELSFENVDAALLALADTDLL